MVARYLYLLVLLLTLPATAKHCFGDDGARLAKRIADLQDEYRTAVDRLKLPSSNIKRTGSFKTVRSINGAVVSRSEYRFEYRIAGDSVLFELTPIASNESKEELFSRVVCLTDSGMFRLVRYIGSESYLLRNRSNDVTSMTTARVETGVRCQVFADALFAVYDTPVADILLDGNWQVTAVDETGSDGALAVRFRAAGSDLWYDSGSFELRPSLAAC